MRRGQQLQRLPHGPDGAAGDSGSESRITWRCSNGNAGASSPADTSSPIPTARSSDWSSRWRRCIASSALKPSSSPPCRRSAEPGYPGVASLDILGNVIPYIAKEEEKMEEEARKLLGKLNDAGVEDPGFRMTAHCNRVAVEDGHTESVSIKLNRTADAGRHHRRARTASSRRRTRWAAPRRRATDCL